MYITWIRIKPLKLSFHYFLKISPLFKHMIHINFPSLCFIGIPIQICPFPQFDLQVQLFVKSICGEWTVPSKEDMNQDTIEEMKTKSNLGKME